MKKYITLVLTVLVTLAAFAAGNTHNKKFKMKPGKYRQMFYLPQAKNFSGVYKLDTTVESAGVRVMITGARDGDYFKVVVFKGSTKDIIMQQFFFMDGSRSEENAIDSWFISYKRDILNNFLLEYFGITIKSRRQFIKEQRTNDFLKASGWEAFLLDKKEKIW